MAMRGTYFALVSAQESAQRVEEKEELQITEEQMSVVGAKRRERTGGMDAGCPSASF